MTKKIRVEVVDEDIREGERLSIRSCPIARAICRASGLSSEDISVTPTEVHFYVGVSGIATSSLPEAARMFVWNFDKGNPVRPITFDLEVSEVADVE